MAGTYAAIRPGAWETPPRQDWWLACCDCGLVHRINFRIRRRRIQLQFFRHARATAALRRTQQRVRVR